MNARPLLAVAAILVVGACRTEGKASNAAGNVGSVGEIHYSAEELRTDPSANIRLEPHRIYGGSTTGEGPLYIAGHVDVDAAGNLYVDDNGNKNVVVFAEDGTLRGTLGGPGQGPGEVQQARGVAVHDGTVYALVDRNRVNIWNTSGDHLRDTRLPQSRSFQPLFVFDDGTLISQYRVGNDGPPVPGPNYSDLVLSGYAVDESGGLRQLREYVRMPSLDRYRLPPVDHPQPIYAIDRRGRIYVSGAATYEIRAIDADGTSPWQLQVDIEPPRVTEDDITTAIRGRRPGFEITRDSFDWPEYLPTLGYLRVDGHGHLYVYRWRRREIPAEVVPVDVFGSDGEHLFSGTIDRRNWWVGRGDLVYAIEDDEASGGDVVVAYRLAEPFE